MLEISSFPTPLASGTLKFDDKFPNPRALTSERKPDLTVFAFELVTASDRVRLASGQTVSLA